MIRNAIIRTVLLLSVMALAVPAASADDGMISGKVVETMNSGGYTYICVEKAGKKTWAAVPQTPVRKGQNVTVKPGMVMENFESKTLKKTFDRIVFSDGIAEAKGGGSAGSRGQVVTSRERITVEKAAGQNAFTVAEAYSGRKKLNNKEVSVRGKVVKVSPGIMQRNWIHLQDGTGNARKGTHNLVVTSQDLPAVGDVVTATGVLHKDKDFGGNYRYSVIIEDAKVAR